MTKKDLICIMCPMGCALHVEQDGDKLSVTGNGCNRGVVFAQEELTNPMRIVTTSVKTSEGVKSCRTSKPIPKNLVFDCVREVEKLRLDKVEFGQVIIHNVLGTDADVVVTANK